jgi:hypothetical protein
MELKVLSDAGSGVSLQIELMEGKEAMQAKEFSDEHKSTTACMMRLTKHLFNTGRTVCGDSWFASVTNAMQLKKNGLFFIGPLKTATRHFPAKWLSELGAQLKRGEWITKVADVAETKVIALAWRDSTLKTFVATTGSTENGSPLLKKRFDSLVDDAGDVEEIECVRSVALPKVVEQYFSNCNVIDVHNHYRQAGLMLEQF